MTEVVNNPESYSPKFNINNGQYEDDTPPTSKAFKEKYKYGLVCCNGNKFLTRTSFRAHTRTQIHKNWLESFSQSGDNDPVKKNLNLEKTVKTQQILIGHLENQLFNTRLKLKELKDPEVFYVIKERESVRLNEKVFKIGITRRSFLERFKDYPEGSLPLCVYNVNDSKKIEDKVKGLFIRKYRLVRGNEYFEGRLPDMIKDIAMIMKEHN